MRCILKISILLWASCSVELTNPSPPSSRPDGGQTLDSNNTTKECTNTDGHLVYLNRLGGSFTPGDENSALDTTPIVQDPVEVAPLAISDSRWVAVVECLAETFSPYNVRFTDWDPFGSEDHMEVVFTSTPSQEIEETLPMNAAAVAELECAPNKIRGGIGFVFDVDVTTSIGFCRRAAFVIASRYGLDSTTGDHDATSGLYAEEEFSFRDEVQQCGSSTPRPCGCQSIDEYNPHLAMLEAAGVNECKGQADLD